MGREGKQDIGQAGRQGWHGGLEWHSGQAGHSGQAARLPQSPRKPWPWYLWQCRWCGQPGARQWCQCRCSAAARCAAHWLPAHRHLPQRSRRAQPHRAPLSVPGHPAPCPPGSHPAEPQRPPATKRAVVRQPCILPAPGGTVGTWSSPGTAAGPWQAALPIPGAKHCPGSPVGSIPLSPPLPPFAA